MGNAAIHVVDRGSSISAILWCLWSRGRCPNGSQRMRPARMITLDLTKNAVRPQRLWGILLSAVSFQPRGMIMSNIIETLLLRNLQEVFGEGDPERRRCAIEELYTEDCVVNLPVDQYHGHDALDRICGELRASHPSYVYTPHNAPIAVQDGGRVDWGSGPAGEPPRYTGIDIIITRDDKISALYVFLNSPPI